MIWDLLDLLDVAIDLAGVLDLLDWGTGPSTVEPRASIARRSWWLPESTDSETDPEGTDR